MNFLATAVALTLTWTTPTSNTDGTPSSPPLTYNVYQGAKGAVKTATATKLSPLTFVADPAKGNCFELTTTDKDGDEGPHSAEVCAPSLPLSPGAIKIVVTITSP